MALPPPEHAVIVLGEPKSQDAGWVSMNQSNQVAPKSRQVQPSSTLQNATKLVSHHHCLNCDTLMTVCLGLGVLIWLKCHSHRPISKAVIC